jgi:short subunit dehydrogenase-like uncharacterized protein
MIYGSTGFTGRLIAQRAVEAGLAPVLAGRNAEQLREQADDLGLQWKVFALDDAGATAGAVADTDVVIHAAGPFLETAGPMIEACLRARAHYLDISGELPAFQEALRRDPEAIEAGVMLMPGAAWSVVATDCLAAHVAGRLENPKYLRIGIARSSLASRGSARTALGLFSSQVAIRRNGALTSVPMGRLERSFDYGEGPRPSTALSWPDVLCAGRTTGVPNIEVYMDVGATTRILAPFSSRIGEIFQFPVLRPLLRAGARILPVGPDDDAREDARQVIVAEAEDSWRGKTSARLTTPDGYGFTAQACVAIAERVLSGDHEPGFQTPAGLFGADFVLGLEGARRDDVWGTSRGEPAQFSDAMR